MAIPHAFIQDLIARADIVDVVGRYITLKKAGANFKGLCPFHGEKTPSFMVNPVKQIYHCFGCGAHGDALRFLMEHNGLNFIEAIKDLAQQLGVQVPQDEESPQERAVAQQRKAKQTQLTDVLAKAAQYWQVCLSKSQRATAYVKHRGLSQDIAARFVLGYADSGWQELANAFANYEDPLLVESGLVIAHETDPYERQVVGKRYDRFRDRLMFPIRNIKGEVIGFGGRVLDQGEPKYLNSPETPVFSKGHELYGLYEARGDIRQAGYLLVTEGYMDVVALAQHGILNAVATLGTACTAEHIQKIFKFTESVVFSFDGDKAGRRAARRALEAALPFAKDTRTIKFLFLPAEHDPDSFVRQQGAQSFKQHVAQAMPLSQFLLEAAQEGCDLSTPEGRARMLAQAYPLWTQFPQGALSIQLLAEIANAAHMNVPSLQGLWAQQGKRGQNAAERGNFSPSTLPPSYSRQSQQPYAAQNWGGRASYGEWGKRTTDRNFKSWSYKGGKKGWKGSPLYASLPPLPPARAPVTPVQHCIRMLLTNSQWWEQISPADQEMLCTQPSWYGAFFKWLERLVVDGGPMSWAVLSQAAKAQPWYDLMIGLMDRNVLEMEVRHEELLTSLERIRKAKALEESARILQQFKSMR